MGKDYPGWQPIVTTHPDQIEPLRNLLAQTNLSAQSDAENKPKISETKGIKERMQKDYEDWTSRFNRLDTNVAECNKADDNTLMIGFLRPRMRTM